MTPGHDQPGVWGSVLHRLTTRRAATVLAVAGVIAALCIAMTTRLRPVASLEAMVAADDPAARALQRITRHFSGTEELIVLASWPGESDQGLDAPAAEPSDALLAFARRLVERIESSPELTALCRDVRYRPAAGIRTFIESVVLPNALFYLDDDAMAALQEHLSPEAMRDRFRRAEEMLSAPMAAGPAAQAARRDPLGLRAILRSALPRPAPSHGGAAALDRPFLSADGRHLMIRVRGRRPASDLAFAGALTQAVKAAADQVNRDGLALSYTGAYAIAAAARRAVRADMIRSIVLSIIFLQVLYCIVYRNVWLLPAALAPVALGILAGFAVYAALGLSLTPITAVIGAILAGLGIDYCIHSLCHYRLDRATGLTHEDAARHAMIDVTPAMTAACVTTVIGFLALSRSSVQALREFGLLGAMGIAASLIAAVVVLPAILTVTVGRRGRAGRLDNNVRRSWPARLLGHAVRHHRLFLWIGAAAAATAAVAIVQSRADASFFDHDSRVLHPRPNEPLDTRERIAEWFNLPGDPLVVHLQAGTPEGLIALAHQVKKRLGEPVARNAGITHTYGLADWLPDPSAVATRRAVLQRSDVDRVLNDFDDALAVSPFHADAFADYRTFLRTLLSSNGPPGVTDLLRYPGLAASVLPDRGYAQAEAPTEAVTVVFTDRPLQAGDVRRAAIEAAREATQDLAGVTLTGLTVLQHDTQRTIRRELRRLLCVAAGAVFLWLMLFFRSVRDALLALAPAAFGLIILLACMPLIGLKLNMVNLIALPLLVGIGVDDGIFLVTAARRLRARAQGGNDRESLAETVGPACHAVAMTSATTILTFGSLAFTSTPAIRSLGLLMALGVAAGFVGATWLLVPLLTVRGGSGDGGLSGFQRRPPSAPPE